MSGPDLSPVKPYPGYPGLGAAEATSSVTHSAARPRIEPAEPRSWSTTIKLQHPLVVDGELLDSVTIRRLTGADVTDLLLQDDEDVSLNIRARALMAALHPDVIEAFSGDDGEAFAAACRPLLPASLVALEQQFRADAEAQI